MYKQYEHDLPPMTQLHHHRENVTMMRQLLEQGADPNQPCIEIYSHFFELQYQCKAGNVEQIKLLLEFGANVHVRYIDCGSTLFHAVANNYNNTCEEIVCILLKKGLDINLEDKFGITPLMDARVSYANACNVATFIKYGAKPTKNEIEHMKRYLPDTYKMWIRKKWVPIRCCVKLLGLHQRAVVTANHPLRKLERGEFKEEDEFYLKI